MKIFVLAGAIMGIAACAQSSPQERQATADQYQLELDNYQYACYEWGNKEACDSIDRARSLRDAAQRRL